MYFTISILLLASLNVIILVKRNRKSRRSKQYDDMIEIFGGHDIRRPALEFGSCYGSPTFTVRFSSREDYEYAKERKLFEAFERTISAYYDARFNPHKAIDFRYPGMTVRIGGMDMKV